ncbi:MAG: HlyD family efflux transporter periplasmic adaptor subunit [bacterium]|nr:HlyD family efflux transporter periplasmic adaptor subunit [bacterium]
MKHTLHKIIVTAVLFSLLTFCGKGNGSQIKAPGVVDADIITLKAQVAGTLENLAAAEGDSVEKKSLIAQINNEKIHNKLKELDISLKELEINRSKITKKKSLVAANLKYLKKQVTRFKRLKKNRSIAGEKLESMELRLLEAETSHFDLDKSLESLDTQNEKIHTKIEYLNLLLKDHTVLSPVKGLIMEKFVSEGENVFPNTAVVDVLDTASLYVEVFIEESEISLLELNKRAKIIIDGLEQKELSGIISYFGKKAEFSPKYIISEKERKALLYKVKIKIDKDIKLFKVGMPVTVVFN